MPKRLPFLLLLAALSAARADELPNPATRSTLSQPDTRFDLTGSDELPAPASAPEGSVSQNGGTLTFSDPEELLQHPGLLHRALSSSVIAANTAAIKLLLPVYRRLPEGQDPVLLETAEGMAAQSDGRYREAVRHLQNAHRRMPDAFLVRLRLAQALKDDHRNVSAQAHYTALLATPDLDPQARAALQSQLDEIRSRSRWTPRLSAHYTRDNNVNNATKERTLRYGSGEWTLPAPEKARGLSYSAGLARDFNLADNLLLRSETDLYGKFYWDNHRYDDLTVRTALGAAYQSGRSETALLPYYERRWYGTEPYSRETGLRAEWQHSLSTRHRLSAAAESGYQHYDTRKFLEGRNSSLSATWIFQQSPRQYFTLGADFSRKRAHTADDAYHRRGLRASAVRVWGKGFGTALSAGYGRRRYDAADFFRIRRDDKEYSASLSLWHNRLSLWGVTPRLVTVWQKTTSNHPLYGYRKANAYLQIGKSF